MRSPSSRRAWIEILAMPDNLYFSQVAFLAEGVDRNYRAVGELELLIRVAFLAEGVDRNKIACGVDAVHVGRLPRGGRG